MFEPNKNIQKAINTLYDNIKDMDYGTRVSWMTIKKLSGYEGATKDDLYYIANKVCILLMRNDQKYLVTERKIGKRIIRPDEHSLYARSKAKQSVRIYRKAGAIIACANMDKCTEEVRTRLIQDANKYSTIKMFAEELLKKKRIGTPSRDNIKTAGLFLDAIKLFAEKK